MSDLYGVLGVSRSADAGAIRAAYRRRSKLAHPDCVGGSVARFTALKEASEVLLSEERRAFYDATGCVKAAEIDQGRGAVLQLLGGILSATVAETMKRGIDLCAENLVELITAHLQKQITTFSTTRGEIEKRVVLYTDLAARFECADPSAGGGGNVLRAICEGAQAACGAELALLEKNRGMHEAALKIVRGHRFRRSEKGSAGHYPMWATGGATGSIFQGGA
jgi:hypothetical protein